MPKHEACPSSIDLDLYSGCSFACAYCVAQERHEAPSRPCYTRSALAARLAELSGAAPVYLSPWTDAYQPLEEEVGATRHCLEVLVARRHPFFVVTRSPMVLRDLALLREAPGAFVALSVSTVDASLVSRLERAPSAEERLAAAGALVAAGVRTVIKIDPVILGVNDGARAQATLEAVAAVRPYGVTCDTLRLNRPLYARLAERLSVAERQALVAAYAPLGEDYVHPHLASRLAFLEKVAAFFRGAGIRAAFCHATLPVRLSPFGCRGGD